MSKANRTTRVKKENKVPSEITLKLHPALALDLVKSTVAWRGASFAQTAQELMMQINEQLRIDKT